MTLITCFFAPASSEFVSVQARRDRQGHLFDCYICGEIRRAQPPSLSTVAEVPLILFKVLPAQLRFISCQLQGKCNESTKRVPFFLFVRVFPRAFGSCLVSLADFPQPLLLDNVLLLVGNVHL
jgi:hypothetical protein